MRNNLFSEDIKKLFSKKKENKRIKTFYLSEETIARIMEIYAKEGGRQSKIVEDAIEIYYKLYKILGKEKLEKLKNESIIEKLKEVL